MNIEELREFCLAMPATSEGMPFGDDTLVFKVAGKMFALASLQSQPLRVNLKCDPAKAIELREQHPSVIPGYHMNKQQWNTVIIDGSVPHQTIKSWINDSYELVLRSLPKKKQAEIRAE